MTRRFVIGFAMLATTIGCGSDRRAGADRIVLVSKASAFINPAVAKDGRLAFSRLVGGKSAIFVADADGRNSRRVSFGVWDFQPYWSDDGKWIAFNRDANGGDIVVVPSAGGDERVAGGTPTSEQVVAWLPGSADFLFQKATGAGAEIWVYHLATGASEKFLHVATNSFAYPSPDGNLIAYTRTNASGSTVWIWNRSTNTHRQLTTEGFEGTQGKFSPDGRSLLVGSRRTGALDLWRVDVITGERTQLTRDVAEDANGRWSPDGKRVLFFSTRGGQPDLWVLSTGEGDVQRVTDDAAFELNADWTPDGQITFVVRDGFFQVQAVPLDGGTPIPLAAGDWEAGIPAASNDGKLVAYASTKNGDEDIWVVPTAGGDPRLVSSSPAYDRGPQWSPDGRTVAFESGRAGSADIWLVDADGSRTRQLTTWPSPELSPRFSPDGKSILFISSYRSPQRDLWSVPVSGGAPRRITTGGIALGIHSWSPDGSSIVFNGQTAASGGRAVFVVAATGGTPRLIAPTDADGPTWSPDGREIAIQRSVGGFSKVEVYNTAGRLIRTLTSSDTAYEVPVAWIPDGSGLVITFQDLNGDGGFKLAVQDVRGARRVLGVPVGSTTSTSSPRVFADDAKAIVVAGGPTFNSFVQVKAPASK